MAHFDDFNRALKSRYGTFPISLECDHDLVALKYLVSCNVFHKRQAVWRCCTISELKVQQCRGATQVYELFGLNCRSMVLNCLLDFCRGADKGRRARLELEREEPC